MRQRLPRTLPARAGGPWRLRHLGDPLVERLTADHERHGQRWQLHIPCAGEPFAEARPLLLVLGLPTLGLAFAISVVTTYGPVVLAHLTTSSTEIGLLIGGEGAFALVVPLLSGPISDRLPGPPLRKRLPFVIVGAPLLATGVILLPFSPSYLLAGGTVFVFFVGYYLYYPPYRALYADLLPREFFARAQANQAVLRGVGLGVALLAGGLLLDVWQPLPFLLAGVLAVVTALSLKPIARLESDCPNPTLPYWSGSVRDLLLQHRSLRLFFVANALWEFSFAGLKSFIVLYVIRGLGGSPAVASAVIAVVAIAYVVAAPVAGRLGDRYGIVRVLRPAAAIYGAGLVLGVVPHTLTPMLAAFPFVALAGAILMTLPQALAFTLAPVGSEGAAAGLLDFSRGIGVVLGPLAVGVAIDAFSHQFAATHGYAAMWPVVGVPVLVSTLLLRRLDGELEVTADRAIAPLARAEGS
jgi:MFS family permease